MTIQEFIPYWQGQPFRPFNLHTTRGVFPVPYPLRIGLSPTLEIAVVVETAGKARAELFPLTQIIHCEVTGNPVDLAQAVAGVRPEILARDAQILAQATTPAATPPPPASAAAFKFSMDPGSVSMLAARAKNGVFLVFVTVSNRQGEPILSTAGTRWNLHGLEQFENGTSLYLHHLDHPTVEQRIIIWPPDRGTFESFAEAKSAAALGRELRRRDTKLSQKPARVIAPSAAYLEQIQPKYPVQKTDGRAEAFGEDQAELDPKRFQLAARSRRTASGDTVKNPRITDRLVKKVVWDLTGTDWHTDAMAGAAPERLSLRYGTKGGATLELALDLKLRTARVDGHDRVLPLAFIQRHLVNYALYELWDIMYDALVSGPGDVGQPDLVLPGVNGFQAAMWAGEPRYQAPFLQAHVVATGGRTLLDLRGTSWAACVRLADDRPEVSLRFVSGERENRWAAAHLEVVIDLVTHQVRSADFKGSTTLGMLQTLLRNSHGAKWLREELQSWFEKGRPLPVPVPEP